MRTEELEQLKKERYRKIIAEIIGGSTIGKAFKNNGLAGHHGQMQTPLFKECLAEIPDGWILARLTEIMKQKDSRAALQAIQMLMKLKDKFPAGKLKIQELQAELDDIQE